MSFERIRIRLSHEGLLNRINHSASFSAYQFVRQNPIIDAEGATLSTESWCPSAPQPPQVSKVFAVLNDHQASSLTAQQSPLEAPKAVIELGRPSSGVLSVPPTETGLAATSGLKELSSWSDALKVADSYKASILVVGFGSKGQYEDPQAAQFQLDQLTESFDAEYGKGKWLVVFGGDPYKADSPDVACMVHHLQENHAAPVMA